MILLEQVSTIDLLNWAEDGFTSDITKIKSEYEELQIRCYELLMKYQVFNYQILKDLIDSQNLDFDIEFLKKSLSRTQMTLARANERGKNPTIYSCNNYKSCDIDSNTLSLTDRNTLGSVLPTCSVLTTASKTRKALDKYSIETIKRLLGQVVLVNVNHISSTVPNAFVQYGPIFGINNIYRLIELINFYEEQVVRQAKETNLRGIDMFALNKENKLKLVREQLNEILEYILNCGNSQFFGIASDKRDRILRAVINNEDVHNAPLAKEKILDFFSSYTTMGELEQGLVRSRAIDRFFSKN